MNTLSIRSMIPFDDDYLKSFKLISLDDVPDDMKDRYFRLDSVLPIPPEEESFFVVNSRNAISRAIINGYELQLLFLKNHTGYIEIMEYVRTCCPEASVCLLNEAQLSSLTCDPDGKIYSFGRFGLSGLFRKKPVRSLDDILKASRNIVVFRNFSSSEEDFQELGPQVRSAAAFFADAVLFKAGCVDPYDRVLIRTTIGNNFHVPFTVYESDEELSAALSKYGFTTALISPADVKGSVPLHKADFSGRKLAVISDHAIQKGQDVDPALTCDLSVYIPGSKVSGMPPGAVSIALYNLFGR